MSLLSAPARSRLRACRASRAATAGTRVTEATSSHCRACRATSRSPSAPGPSHMAGKPQTVLVVEDEASIASFVSAYLKNAGYAVRTTASGNEALRLVESEKPALVVLDLMLPDIDGVEVCKRIRQHGDLPVLMLTARDEDVDKIIGLEVGADDYMTKPF